MRVLAPVPDGELTFTTLIMPARRVRKGCLHKLEAKAALTTLKRQIERAALPSLVIMGGLDLSLEIDRRHGNHDAWQLHVHLIHYGCTRGELRKALRSYYPPTDEVSRPIQSKRVGNRVEALSYCHKGVWQRYSNDFNDAGELTRRLYPLRDEEWREVLRYLDRYSFNELLVLKGVRRVGSELRIRNKLLSRKRVENSVCMMKRSFSGLRWSV
jgi:hypothetical protein